MGKRARYNVHRLLALKTLRTYHWYDQVSIGEIICLIMCLIWQLTKPMPMNSLPSQLLMMFWVDLTESLWLLDKLDLVKPIQFLAVSLMGNWIIKVESCPDQCIRYSIILKRIQTMPSSELLFHSLKYTWKTSLICLYQTQAHSPISAPLMVETLLQCHP